MQIRIRIGGQDASQTGCAGRLGASLFFMAFAGMGLLFIGLVGRELERTHASWFWSETTCCVIEASVENRFDMNHNQPARLHVRYDVARAGVEHIAGTTWSLAGSDFADFGEANRIALRLRPGSIQRCWVDSAEPSRTVLARTSLWGVLFILIPLPFVAIGLGGLWAIWRGARSRPRPISAQAEPTGRGGRVIGAIVCYAIIAGLGAAVINLSVLPAMRVSAAGSWRATLCTIVASRVGEHRGDKGSRTYSIDVLFYYRADGRDFLANRYQFLGGASSGEDAKARIVAALPPGHAATCWIDPSDPTDAVFDRSLPGMAWVGLVPGIFMILPIIGLVAIRRKSRAAPRVVGSDRDALPVDQPTAAANGDATADIMGADTGEVELRPRQGRMAKVLALFVFNLIWNGVVWGIILGSIVPDWQRGRPQWFPAIFLLLFALVGTLFVGLLMKELLALRNPRVHLRTSAARVPLGGELAITWQIDGAAGRIVCLRLVLEGEEVATYRRGTRSYTDRRVFARMALAEVRDAPDIATGAARVRLPATTMHSFKAANNRIEWTLRVHGDIPRWPDIADDYPIEVLPLPHPQPKQASS